jgi:hypothetical protein
VCYFSPVTKVYVMLCSDIDKASGNLNAKLNFFTSLQKNLPMDKFGPAGNTAKCHHHTTFVCIYARKKY